MGGPQGQLVVTNIPKLPSSVVIGYSAKGARVVAWAGEEPGLTHIDFESFRNIAWDYPGALDALTVAIAKLRASEKRKRRQMRRGKRVQEESPRQVTINISRDLIEIVVAR